MKGIRKAIDAVYSFLTYFGIITVLAMILIVAFNVFSRLTSGKTIGWGEEVALILMVWFSMIGLALGVKMKLHISIELFTMKLSDRIKTNVINRISNVCSLIVGIVMFYFGIKLVQNGMTSTLPATLCSIYSLAFLLYLSLFIELYSISLFSIFSTCFIAFSTLNQT